MRQEPLFMTAASSWQPPRLDTLPPWKGVKRIAVDVESRDETLRQLGPGLGIRKNAYVTGISFAIEDGPKAYLPIRHDGGDNLPLEGVLSYMRAQARDFDGEIVGANLGYDIQGLASDGIWFNKAKGFKDVLLAAPLINELELKYSLDAVLTRAGLEGKTEELLRAAAVDYGINPKSDMWRLPARFVGPYAEDDSAKLHPLLRLQEREIEAQELEGVFDLENRLLPILTRMRIRGVRIDERQLDRVEAWALAQEAEMLRRIKTMTNVRIPIGDIMNASIVAPALLSLGVKLHANAKGQYSIDQEKLATIDHEVARCIERARKVNKLRTTFAASVRSHMVNGRLHVSFNQLRKTKEEDGDEGSEAGAAYGRLSSEHVNIQQQPARDDFAIIWRMIYLPEEGQQWASPDYSQQEPRMAVHYACKAGRARDAKGRPIISREAYESALDARNKYRDDPSTDNHQMMANMIAGREATGKERKAAKIIYLGLSYGMGGAKMCRGIGLPTMMAVRGPWRSEFAGRVFNVDSPEGRACLAMGERRYEAAGPEGQAIIDEFDRRVPYVRAMAKACEQRAKAVGYITTLSGRRCRFPTGTDGNYEWAHKAFNRLLQGSSADQTKTAMVELDAAGFGDNLLIQVHDEVPLSVDDLAHGERAAEVMRHCTPLEVPSKVDVEIGRTWGHSMLSSGDGDPATNLARELAMI